MSADLVYGHDDGNASLEVRRASADPQGVPMTYVSVADDRCLRPRDVYFTPPALRAMHTAIGIRLVETDRLQTGRPARLVQVERKPGQSSFDHDGKRVGWTLERIDGQWNWLVTAGASAHGYAADQHSAEADVAALLRARGYVVEGG